MENIWVKEKDELGWVHYLRIDDDYSIKAEKSPAGDYFVTVVKYDDIAGGEVEYMDTLRQAKQYAEKLLSTGEWMTLIR